MMAQVFHTVIIRLIPQMSLLMRTQARRFITLIDTFYDNNVRVLFSAEVPLNELFIVSNNKDDDSVHDDDRKLMDDLGIQLGTVCI